MADALRLTNWRADPTLLFGWTPGHLNYMIEYSCQVLQTGLYKEIVLPP